MKALDRFMRHVEIQPGIAPMGCWLWSAFIDDDGYSRFKVDGVVTRGHRFAYEQFVGLIPNGLEIDHLCRARRCVNPWHLEPVTRRVNVLRGVSFSASKAKQTHCIRGHELSGDNVYPQRWVKREWAGRSCRTCVLASIRRRYRLRDRRASS